MKHFLVGAVIALAATHASAATLKVEFSGVIFDDTGTAAGSFLFDTDTLVFSAIDISTTPGTTQMGNGYTVIEPSTGTDQILFTNQNNEIFEFQISEDLEVLGFGQPFTVEAISEGTPGNTRHAVDYGSVSISAVPLPASAPLILAGVGALAAVGRRRKARS